MHLKGCGGWALYHSHYLKDILDPEVGSWLPGMTSPSITDELTSGTQEIQKYTEQEWFFFKQGDALSSAQSTWVWNVFLEARESLAGEGQEHEEGPVLSPSTCPLLTTLSSNLATGHISSLTCILPS